MKTLDSLVRAWTGVKRGIACLGLCAALYITTGCDEDEAPYNGPTITNIAAPDYFEGNSQVGAVVTVPSGYAVSFVEFSYRPLGSAGDWTTVELTGTSFYSKTIDFESDEYEYQVYAEDVQGYGSIAAGTMRKWAEEVNGDIEVLDTLDAFYDNNDILDYDVNTTLDVGGNIIACDYWVLFDHPSFGPTYALGWHQGQTDGDHAAEKAICEANDMPWSQINPCVADEIAAKLDEIMQYGWEWEN